MKIIMIANSQFDKDSPPAKYRAFASAYLQASMSLCQDMIADELLQTWPNASIVMMLAAHSVELFLKGALVIRDSAIAPRCYNIHDLLRLKTLYDEAFPEPEFAWDIPFKTEYIGLSEEEIEEIAKLRKEQPVPSMLHRYPDKKPGVSWNIAGAFQPE